MRDEAFEGRFKALTGNAPFPWQVVLFKKWFAKGRIPRLCSLPTGLGKTSICGTVDMIDSLLLFSGYRAGWNDGLPETQATQATCR